MYIHMTVCPALSCNDKGKEGDLKKGEKRAGTATHAKERGKDRELHSNCKAIVIYMRVPCLTEPFVLIRRTSGMSELARDS